jgi:cytoskeleton protein RodZ
MTRFGDELRHERQSRGLSVEDVCAVTKVSVAHITALEAGEFDRLPGGVFRKGILRSYLAALSLDESLWMERFTLKKSRTAQPPGMALRWLGVAILMVTLFAVIWLAWHFVRRHRLSIRETTSAEWMDNTSGHS